MSLNTPTAELDPRFSSDAATALPWSDARDHLAQAELFWLCTVRPDGRPHVTPLIAVWLDDALYFCTGASERKAHNLADNAQCVLTTGNNTLNAGLDIAVEGVAERIIDLATLARIAAAYVAKYGEGWRFTVSEDGAFIGAGGEALVYGVRPAVAFGFGKGTFSQTRWRF
ncbi:MAG: pyridoxamine 5'-phosphate oxidase family protein [Ktedonobacterales bacterium]|nr:pyridoxamine 5'-phosphate oxidase family protein [Ktedonobacterales bacterium]